MSFKVFHSFLRTPKLFTQQKSLQILIKNSPQKTAAFP